MWALSLVSGCSTIRPVSASATLDGQRAKDIRVVLSEPYSYTPSGLLMAAQTLPAGNYTAFLEDDDGVYFQSPVKILFYNSLKPTTVQDGGVFFKGGQSNQAYEFIFENNQPEYANLKLPSDFKFRVEKTAQQQSSSCPPCPACNHDEKR
jgi:hypothetical protein